MRAESACFVLLWLFFLGVDWADCGQNPDLPAFRVSHQPLPCSRNAAKSPRNCETRNISLSRPTLCIQYVGTFQGPTHVGQRAKLAHNSLPLAVGVSIVVTSCVVATINMALGESLLFVATEGAT